MNNKHMLYEIAYELIKLSWIDILCIGEHLKILNETNYTADKDNLVEMVFMKAIEKEKIDELKKEIIKAKNLEN